MTTSLPLSCSQFPSSLQNSLLTNKFPSHFQTRPQKSQAIRCNAPNDKNTPHLDRRNLLVGMGGLYGAASSLDSSPAFATPISGPDFSKCTVAKDVFTDKVLGKCCPPLSDGIIDYKLPPVTALRFRPAAHLAGKDYIAKYEKALELMKALPPEDPRSFTQQANVHCAYCNLTYPQTGDPDQKLQIHFNWLFFPWHRWYLYFYERILGKLIDDPTFGLPFWNWDHPDGMVMPEMFNNEGSTLYDAKRDQLHRPGNGNLSFADLRYDLNNNKDRVRATIDRNLQEVHTEMVGGARRLRDFYGARYVTGSKYNIDRGPGSVERGSHTALHLWVGDPSQPNREDMGNFYSSGREPLFFSHHANIDRLWSVYQDLRACRGRPGQFKSPDWLDANFLFYDENKQLVRVRVRDGLDNLSMGYTSQKVDLPWLRYKSERREKRKPRRPRKPRRENINPVFPVKLDRVVRVLVDRPRKSRSKEEKEREEELLVIEEIEVDSTKFVRFEVFVNDEDDKWEEVVDIAEYAGSYSNVPINSSGGEVVKSTIRLGLGEVLEFLDADDDDQVLVSLVPQAGGEDVIIGGIKIIYDDEADDE